MFCHVEPEQVAPPLLPSPPTQPTVGIETKLTLQLLPPNWPGHLRARRVVHLPGAAAAGEPGRGGLPEQEAQHAHRDPAQEDADQVEGDVRQASRRSASEQTSWRNKRPPKSFIVKGSAGFRKAVSRMKHLTESRESELIQFSCSLLHNHV